MNNQEAIKILGQYDVSALHFYTTDGEEIPFQEWSDAIEMAISSLRIQDKLLDILKGFGSDLPCDESPDNDWCAEHCKYVEPQNDCWIRWANGVLGLPLEGGVQKK